MPSEKGTVFNGKLYQKDPGSTSSYRRAYQCDETGQSLHCAIWIFHHGPIPRGFHVHHKDGKKWHNEIANFELLSASDHTKEHWARKLYLQRECRQCHKKFKTRSTKGTAVKFCSNTCKANHRRLSRVDFITRPCTKCGTEIYRSRFKFGKGLCAQCAPKTRPSKRIEIDRSSRPCAQCQQPFTPSKYAGAQVLFCSKNCKQANRRARGVDNIISICSVCGEPFPHNKHDPQRHCSQSCANKTMWEKRPRAKVANLLASTLNEA